jgi:hypothetical protein
MNEQAADLEGLFPSSVNFMFWGVIKVFLPPLLFKWTGTGD